MFVSFLTILITWARFQTSRPHHVDPGHGFTRLLSGNGLRVYISNADATGHTLLFFAFGIASIAFIVFVPKEPFKLPDIRPWKARIAAHLNSREAEQLLRSTPYIGSFTLVVLLLCSGFIYLFGPAVTQFMVSHSAVLD